MTIAGPDVCKTPTSGGPVPIPYPNISKSCDTSQGSKTVKVDKCPIMLKGSKFATSTGDEAGSVGGIMSSTTKGKSEFVNFSQDVRIEGKLTPRLMDPMICNESQRANTPPAPEFQPPLVAFPATEVKGDYHELYVFFRYKDPDITKGWSLPPAFNTKDLDENQLDIKIEISGPVKKTYTSFSYSGARFYDVPEGKYSFEIKNFDLKPRHLKKGQGQ